MSNGSGGIHLPHLTKLNKIIIITAVAVFILQSILKQASGVALEAYAGLSSVTVLHGMIYQFITYPLMGSGLIEIVFNSLILWFIGCELETMWGRGRYINFLLAVVLGGGLIFFVISLFLGSGFAVPLTGLAGVASSLLLAYAILFPNKTFLFMLIFPMRAKYFCMILIGMQLYLGFFSPAGVLAWGHLGSMLSGFLFMVWTANRASRVGRRPKKKKSRANLHIVQDFDQSSDSDEKKDPKYWQ